MNADYLIIGSGAVGMSFADTLLDDSDAHATVVYLAPRVAWGES